MQEFWDHRYEYVEDIAERAVKAQFKEILCCFGGVPGPMARVVQGSPWVVERRLRLGDEKEDCAN